MRWVVLIFLVMAVVVLLSFGFRRSGSLVVLGDEKIGEMEFNEGAWD